jgi:hypothetical protein
MAFDLGAILQRILGLVSKPEGQTLITRVWEFPPDYWCEPTIRPCADLFPEWDRIPEKKRDFGIAFSGGGTRSASATVGQLRGLRRNGWLSQAGYISSVSGGTWAAVPFTFSSHDEATFLGEYLDPWAITWDSLKTTKLHSFNYDIAHAALDKGQIVLEVAKRLLGDNSKVQGLVANLLGRTFTVDPRITTQFFGDLQSAAKLGREGTFATLLSGAFLADHLPGAESLYFTWQDSDGNEIEQTNPGVPFPDGFALAHPDRPFIIANASILHTIPGFRQSPVPVEYTPLYCGTRQQMGPAIGGTYVWPAGYATHSPTAALGSGPVRGYARATTRDAKRPFSVADVLGSSGAAPEYVLSETRGNATINLVASEAAAYFAHLPTWSMRHGAISGTLRGVPHADGGAIDNLGLLALLARQVKNVIVFVNANEHYFFSDDLRDICGFGSTQGTTTNHGLCQVFHPDRWHEIQRQFNACAEQQEPVVCCGCNWEVLPNQIFNVQGYQGLNICLVYNFPVESWRQMLPDAVKKLVPKYPNEKEMDGDKVIAPDVQLTRFPWFSTMFEQRNVLPTLQVLALAPQATQLLSHLACWSVTHPGTRHKIHQLFQRVFDTA